jgi:hypothetical protein
VKRQLRNPNAARWDFLAGLLPHGIEPTDIDLCIERNGHFLIMEGKRNGEIMPKGQERFLNALRNGPRSVTVVTFWGNPPDEIVAFRPWGQAESSDTTTEGFRTYIRAWFHAHADSRAA